MPPGAKAQPNIQPYINPSGRVPDIENLDKECILRRKLAVYPWIDDTEYKLGWNPDKRQWGIEVVDKKLGRRTEVFTEYGDVMVSKQGVLSNG